MMGVPFRVLSIDGGGVRGYLAASILEGLEAVLDRETKAAAPLGQRFDLIAGTSVGGIIAAGLALGLSAKHIREELAKLLPKVFGSAAKSSGWAGTWWRTKYKPTVLRKELERIFEDHTLRDLQTDTCITSVALATATPRLHKTDYQPRFQERQGELLVDVCLSTSAAPTYFPAHSSIISTNLVDGGMVANNPAMIAYVDAFQFARPSKRGTPAPPRDKPECAPVLLSIGTGKPGVVPYEYEKLIDAGELQWAHPALEVSMLSQSTLVHHQLAFLLDSRYKRIDPTLPKSIRMDDFESMSDLRSLADVTAETEAFCKKWLV